jgi:hypothetical protein
MNAIGQRLVRIIAPLVVLAAAGGANALAFRLFPEPASDAGVSVGALLALQISAVVLATMGWKRVEGLSSPRWVDHLRYCALLYIFGIVTGSGALVCRITEDCEGYVAGSTLGSFEQAAISIIASLVAMYASVLVAPEA